MPTIVAILVTRPEQVAGGAPIFIAQTEEEKERLAFALEKILDATAHDLKNGTMIFVDRSRN